MSRRRPASLLTGLLAVATLLAGCSAGGTSTTRTASSPPVTAASSPSGASVPLAAASDTAVPATPAPPTSSPTTPAPPVPTRVATPTPAVATPAVAAPPAHPPSARPTTAAPKPVPALLVDQLASVGDATQVVTVTAANATTDVATLQTFAKDAAGWHAVFPAMSAHIGLAGFSASKHEGDDKTPEGMYGFGVFFGQHPNPGVKFAYRQADANSVWVDDRAFASPYYNTWQESSALHDDGELLDAPGYATAYAYAADIAYNTNPVVPGKGSAIFLHVSTGGGTAGCVSLAESNLLEVLRWLDPAAHPVIVMGPSATIRQY